MPQVKRITFKSNSAGFRFIDVDTASWEIVATCADAMRLRGKACRLAERGGRVEYKADGGYIKLPASIESIK